MSSLYNLEPQPTGKLILHTTSGDILLELFTQQTPRTCRNFIQLCLDGYYDNTIFHRLVPGFIIQGGDPTGTGAGGESSCEGGKVFEDEFHSRLKFNRRGLLGMANSGERDDNGSQFFLTLGATPELTGRNTMFGRVEGETIFNLVKMGEADLVEGEGSERPMYPTKVTGAEVLVNPFEDMVARMKVATTQREEVLPKKKTAKKKVGKQLLSFGGEEGEDGDVAPVKAAAKFNPKLVAGNGPPTPVKRPAPTLTEDRAPKRRLASRSPSPVQPSPATRTTAVPPPRQPAIRPPSSPSPPPTNLTHKPSLLETTNAQIAALKSSLKRNIPAAPISSVKKSALEAMIPTTSTRGRKRKGNAAGAGAALSREDQRTVDEFKEFRRKLDAAGVRTERGVLESTTPDRAEPNSAPESNAKEQEQDGEEDEEAQLCDLHFIAHCQSCSKWDEKLNPDPENGSTDPEGRDGRGEGEGGEAGWMAHQLTFAKDRLGKDLEWKRQNERELVVIDPREKERSLGVKKGGKEAVKGGEKWSRGEKVGR